MSWHQATDAPPSIRITTLAPSLQPNQRKVAEVMLVDAPSIVAERLPKALIHHNVPGERIHAYLTALDDAWERNASLGTFGAVQRWLATVRAVKEAGWPVQGTSSRWRLGEVTVDWAAVAP